MAMRILVVDDSPTIRTVVSMILERSGYDPTVASDGQDAYEILASGEVKADLILVDFVMPRMNGYQFCRALRDNAELRATPVILMSAKGDRIREQFVQQTGALDAITKPFDRQALVAVIENAMRKVNTAVARASSARLPDYDDDSLVVGAALMTTQVGVIDVVTPRTTEVFPRVTPRSSAPPITRPQPIELETRRTHIAQLVAQKLAAIVARTIASRPEVASSSGLANAIAERLTNDTIVDMMEAMGTLDLRDRGGPLLAGDLGVVPIGAILQLLQSENQTGVLLCTNGGAEVRAAFREGAIDLVQSTGAGDEFRLGRYFIEEGILTPEEIEQFTRKLRESVSPVTGMMPTRRDPSAELIGLKSPTEEPPTHNQHTRATVVMKAPLDAMGSDEEERGAKPVPEAPPTERWGTKTGEHRVSAVPPTVREDSQSVVTIEGRALAESLAAVTVKARPLGMALLAAGKINDAQLRTALTRQSSELLYEVLRWPVGRFELRREAPGELAENAKLSMPVASVVMEGFRRVDEWRALERTLGSFDAVLFRDDSAFGSLDIASLPMKERAVLDAVDGDRTVRAIVAASHLSSFDACRILVQFLEARVLRRRT